MDVEEHTRRGDRGEGDWRRQFIYIYSRWGNGEGDMKGKCKEKMQRGSGKSFRHWVSTRHDNGKGKKTRTEQEQNSHNTRLAVPLSLQADVEDLSYSVVPSLSS